MDALDYQKKMSEARSILGRALLDCERAHMFSSTPQQRMGGECTCGGCTVKRTICLALDQLEW
jgi:hypothetical protein